MTMLCPLHKQWRVLLISSSAVEVSTCSEHLSPPVYMPVWTVEAPEPSLELCRVVLCWHQDLRCCASLTYVLCRAVPPAGDP